MMKQYPTMGLDPKITSPQPPQKGFRWTPEHRARAAESRQINTAARRASTLRRNFKDAAHWQRLASARGLTLPPWGEPPTPGKMRQWLRKIGMSVPIYLEWAGERTLRGFRINNPDWPLRAWAGLLLEEGQGP